MSVNTVPISARTHGLDVQITANGSYTLPKYAFIPHPSLQQLAGARVGEPVNEMVAASFAAPAALQRNLPTVAPVYGVRTLHLKSSA